MLRLFARSVLWQVVCIFCLNNFVLIFISLRKKGADNTHVGRFKNNPPAAIPVEMLGDSHAYLRWHEKVWVCEPEGISAETW